MARIIVTVDADDLSRAPVLLDETVHPVHISSDHAARQLLERLAWALTDAEQIELASARRAAREGSPATALAAQAVSVAA